MVSTDKVAPIHYCSTPRRGWGLRFYKHARLAHCESFDRLGEYCQAINPPLLELPVV
jgi:hypothetical protein